MCASANLKPVTYAKLLYGFEIIRVHDQKYFGGFRVIPTNQAGLFKIPKI